MSNKLYKGCKIRIENKNYELIKQIGQGGSGVVWLSECDGIKYAIKFLHDKKDKNKKERFIQEINFCKESTHKNIIKVIAEEELDDYICYVMPHYEKTFRDIVDDYSVTNIKKLEYIEELCEAIDYAHKNNVIHRDIKPENILIDSYNLVLADFGIAHFKDSRLTQKNDLMANRSYISPELCIKNNAKNVTFAADIFSFGKIINECFTMQNILGTHYKTITDVVPMLSSLDKLVDRMLRQNPMERPGIDEILLELKLHRAQILDLLGVIRENIIPSIDIDIDDNTIELILERASEDILSAKYIFENKSVEECEKYNRNYHKSICYQVDNDLKSIYFQELLYVECLRKFKYESNVYRDGSKYLPLDLDNNEEHIRLYEDLKKILKCQRTNCEWDLSGEILKLFSSCCGYHCEEILAYIKRNIEKRLDDLDDSPILDIVLLLKDGIRKNADALRILYIEERILINWSSMISYESSNDDSLLFRNNVERDIEEVISSFRMNWDAVISKITDESYSLKFHSLEEYRRFKSYALELSRPHYIFEGDVLDLIKIEREYNGIVELKLLNSFDIESTLSKILGLRSDY